jgi:hypothetical protein
MCIAPFNDESRAQERRPPGASAKARSRLKWP